MRSASARPAQITVFRVRRRSADGAAGRFLVNGKTVSEARKMVMQPDDEVTLETPGGGGYGQPINSQ